MPAAKPTLANSKTRTYKAPKLTPKLKKKNAVSFPSRSTTASIGSSNWIALSKTIETTHRKTKRSKKSSVKDSDDTLNKDVKDDVKDDGELWFDIEPKDLEENIPQRSKKSKKDAKPKVEPAKLISGTMTGVTKHVAIDCEMVGTGHDGASSILARVSIVNRYGHTLYDTFVKPKERVTDFRTFVSGVRPKDVRNAPSLEKVQKEVAELLKGKILIGHALKNDFKVLMYNHPKRQTRDSAKYKPFRKYAGGRAPGLKKLTSILLGLEIQTGSHSSVIDAQATMALYQRFHKQWEERIKRPLHAPDNPDDDDTSRKSGGKPSESMSKNLFQPNSTNSTDKPKKAKPRYKKRKYD